ncbi:nucleoside hydrolase [Nanchangia anserum]|uniref:Nucleoside hydrolase n=1 Tax=Nanchangia anserum TaxID=2692125 RepID=A0A8I0GBE0_9ACTO|nr:nucleoside hydrolase [Nanchangia anserum]MBD3688916.1 nucleoside hydrolase [Nanchangia anserum]QOX81180.1 nucleoside hydrolase [Nanchangia anserum]
MARTLILDLDTGIDDSLAIAYAIGSPEANFVAITGTYGNVDVDQGVRNSLAVTELLGRDDIDVVAGVPHALERDGFDVLEISQFIHGRNGIGDVEIPDATRGACAGDGVDYLIAAVERFGHDLVYVPTGPLTTLAEALRRKPEIAGSIGRVVLMGGALTVPGNVNAWTEANIGQDPDAANEVFRSGIPLTMIGLDVTLQTLLTYEHTRVWRDLDTAAGRFLADMTDYYIRAYETTSPHLGGCGLHDPLAVAVALDPSLVTTLPLHMSVDVTGPTRGRTIGNPEKIGAPHPTCEVAVGVDVERFLDMFMTRISAVAAGEKTA